MQQSPEGTESEYVSDPIDRPPSVSSPSQVFNSAQKTHFIHTFAKNITKHIFECWLYKI